MWEEGTDRITLPGASSSAHGAGNRRSWSFHSESVVLPGEKEVSIMTPLEASVLTEYEVGRFNGASEFNLDVSKGGVMGKLERFQ